MNHLSAEQVIKHLNLSPHPEKGYFIEKFRDHRSESPEDRASSTAIYYLLEGSVGYGEWHRVDAAEVWHYYAGAPLVISVWDGDDKPVRDSILGPNILAGEEPQVVVEKGAWQRAKSLGDWTLTGTTVAPGFVESGAQLASEEEIEAMRQSQKRSQQILVS